MGLASLEALPAVIETNRHNHALYRRLLEGLPGLSLMQYEPDERTNYQYVVVLVDDTKAGLTRDELVRFLHSENVLARRYFAPGVQRMPVYRERYANVSLPQTERLCERVMCLPTGTAVSSSEIETVAQLLTLALNNARDVRSALAREATHG
jgi:dTDP-4-amino-4,6-dideoxygalactose transaminase